MYAENNTIFLKAIFIKISVLKSLILAALFISGTIINNYCQEDNTVVFRIQLGTSIKFPDAGSPFRKDFPDVEGIKLEDGVIRVYTGKFETYNEAKEYLPQVQEKGYKYAYVVAFYKGKRITVDEAIQLIYGD
jgi:hypothetical protein